MANPIGEMVKALAVRLRTIPTLTVIENWPTANQTLAYPSLSITTGKPEFMNLQPYLLSKTDPDPSTHQITVKRIVGQYDVAFQLDLWCRNQVERNAYFDLLFAKLNPDVVPMGLRLQLSAYHNQWASFAMTGQQYMDDEAAAQRQEWRCKLDLVGSCKAVLANTETAMITIENQLTTPDTI